MISMGAGRRTLARTLPPWWLMLITGISWTLVALILLRFDYTSVSSISILFGFVALVAGAAEIGVMFMAAGWMKLLHGVLAVVYIVVGIVAFIHPGDTFAALAAVISFFASAGSNLYHFAFSPKAFVSFGSSQLGSPAPKQLCQAEGDSRPCLRNVSTLPNVST